MKASVVPPPINKTLAALARLMRGAVNQQLRDLHIRAAHADLLLYLSDYPDQLQIEIARANFMDPSLLARDLRILERRGWVTRAADQADGRARRVRLSADGEALASKLKTGLEQWWKEFAAAHPDVDLEQFSVLADQVFRGLNEGDRNA